jgi:hypothetical protein
MKISVPLQIIDLQDGFHPLLNIKMAKNLLLCWIPAPQKLLSIKHC